MTNTITKEQVITKFIEEHRDFQYEDQISIEWSKILKEHNLVFIRPQSDDYLSFDGALSDDIYGEVKINYVFGKLDFSQTEAWHELAESEGWVAPPTLCTVSLHEDNAIGFYPKVTPNDIVVFRTDITDEGLIYGQAVLCDLEPALKKLGLLRRSF
jgi:hypothetical protein